MLRVTTLASALSVAVTMGAPSMVRADTTSTVLIAGAAAAIVGALIYDSNNHPYYVQSGHRYYVTNEQAKWYKGHHRGIERRAYVPESEYPVARGYDNRGERERGGYQEHQGHEDHH